MKTVAGTQKALAGVFERRKGERNRRTAEGLAVVSDTLFEDSAEVVGQFLVE